MNEHDESDDGRELVLTESRDELPEFMDEGGLPVINGHQITVFEWNGFKAYVDAMGNKSQASRALGVTRQNFYRWEVEPWWKWLCDRYIVAEQRRTHVAIARKMHMAADTLYDVMANTSPNDRTAGARVNAAQTVLKVGNDPLIKVSPSLQINQNIINNHGTINVNKLKELSPDKLHEIAETLEIPVEAKDF
jgi:hypothetical protein